MLTDHVSIFQSRPDGNGYQLKDGIRFHLYINTAPCGDARIFSPHELEPSETKDGALNTVTDPHPNRKARGQLRTKIESGEGTIPVKSSDAIQTWDGVLQGSRLLTMSCSGMLLIFQSSFFSDVMGKYSNHAVFVLVYFPYYSYQVFSRKKRLKTDLKGSSSSCIATFNYVEKTSIITVYFF